MSALETAKEIGRMAATATLSKDVIDLFEKKVTLLTEEITTLQREKSDLQSENANLKQKVANLEQEIERLKQKSDLEEDAIKILEMLFDRGDLAIEYMADALGIPREMGKYHRDALKQAGLIKQTGMGFKGFGATGDWVDSSGSYGLTPKGRAYVVKHRAK